MLNRVDYSALACNGAVAANPLAYPALARWCNFDERIFPPTAVTDVEFDASSGKMRVHQRNKYVLFYASDPGELSEAVGPFDPFILDRASSFGDARRLAGAGAQATEQWAVLPAFALAYLDENARNKTTDDLLFTALDLATLPLPVTKLVGVARVLAYADKASSVLGIVATHQAGDADADPKLAARVCLKNRSC